ncbi:MAG: hypothetical protein ABW206_09155 [Agrobacterium vaccinii]
MSATANLHAMQQKLPDFAALQDKSRASNARLLMKQSGTDTFPSVVWSKKYQQFLRRDVECNC